MDIKFHVNKIIKSGGDVDDWLDFISQLKNIRTDRDLLLQIYTVALKNLKQEATIGYKRLMIGLANLQSEVSSDLARETYLDAKALDLECAVVCVYYAQFEYLHQHKDKARQIIQGAKQNGCAPKDILKKAYQNWRQNKLSLLDGINDPWNTLCDETEDTTDTENKSSQVLGTTQANRSVTTDLKIKSLPPPTRAISKSKSASSITSNSKWHTPGADVRTERSVTTKKNSVVIIGNKCNTTHERHGPGMSPFMQIKYSPLVKRKFNLDTMPDDGMFPVLYSSAEKCPVITPIKNLSRSSGEYGSENDDVYGSSGSCTSGLFTANVLKKANTDHNNNAMVRSISSPCIFQSSRTTFSSDGNIILDNQVENVGKTYSRTKMEDINTILNSEERRYHTGIPHVCAQPNINVLDNDQKDVLYGKGKNTPKSDGENNLLINRGDTDFISNTPDVNDGVNIKNATKIHKYISPANVKSKLGEHNVCMNMNPIKIENINVDKQNMHGINTISAIQMNEEHVIAIKIVSAKFQRNVYAENKENKPIENKLINCAVGKKQQIPDNTIREDLINDLIHRVNENTNNKVTGSEACVTDSTRGNMKVNTLGEDSRRKIAEYAGDGIAPLGKHVLHPSSIIQMNKIPISYTVKGVSYHRKRLMGKGGSCKVYEVLSEHGKTYALKKVNLQDVDDFMLNMYKNEIKWLEKMKGNKHIIRLFDWEINDQALFLLLEKGDCDLAHTLKNKKTLPREDMKEYWKQMLTAVNIIHEKGIVHTDLKPANFLVVGKMLKLIDFGIANGIQDNKTSVTRECQMGTLNYMSPEALMQDSCRISRASDVWSLGCILYYMIHKKTPYSDIKNQYSRFFALQQGKPIDYTGIDDQLLLNCLQGCLKHNKKERYSIQQLLAHPYLN